MIFTFNAHLKGFSDGPIINKPGYVINALYQIDGTQLIIDTDRFSGVLRRVG